MAKKVQLWILIKFTFMFYFLKYNIYNAFFFFSYKKTLVIFSISSLFFCVLWSNSGNKHKDKDCLIC